MKRLRRIILNVLAIASLLLCIATVGFWLRANGISDTLTWDTRAHREFSLFTARDGVVFSCRALYISEERLGQVMWTRSPSWTAFAGSGRFPGCYHWKDMESEGVRIAWWLIFPMTAVFPCAWFAAFFTQRRRGLKSLGLCPVCSYDLRATPDRCPECGAIPAGANA